MTVLNVLQSDLFSVLFWQAGWNVNNLIFCFATVCWRVVQYASEQSAKDDGKVIFNGTSVPLLLPQKPYRLDHMTTMALRLFVTMKVTIQLHLI